MKSAGHNILFLWLLVLSGIVSAQFPGKKEITQIKEVITTLDSLSPDATHSSEQTVPVSQKQASKLPGEGGNTVSPYDVVKRTYKPEVKLVHDFGNILSPIDRNRLENELVAYNDSTSTQIVVVTFKNLEGYPIELLGNEIGEYWGVGQKGKHNGIVIVLSDEDHKVTIRGGYGIQAKLPHTIEKLIIDREMIPQFRTGNYYQGLQNGITAIMQQLNGQYQADSRSSDNDGLGLMIFFLFLGILLLFIFLSKRGGGKGGRRGGRFLDDVIITNMGSGPFRGGGGFGGGFGSGGGFGGFGGGSFGGGGASGSW